MGFKPTFHRTRSDISSSNNHDNNDIPATDDEDLSSSSIGGRGTKLHGEMSNRRIIRYSTIYSFLHRLYQNISLRLYTRNHPKMTNSTITTPTSVSSMLLKKALVIILFIFVITFSKRFIHLASFFTSFLNWMQQNPRLGIAVYVLVYASHLILLFPGTPFVLGAGYVYKRTYGWTVGIILCSFLSLLGSLLGSVGAFLLGRYCIKEWVRNRWNQATVNTAAGTGTTTYTTSTDDSNNKINTTMTTNTTSTINGNSTTKKSLYVQALDSAISENGFKIMVMLYLTPITPLGPLSYLIGTTNMKLSSFAKAKIASLPLIMMYVFLGASTGELLVGKSHSHLERKNLVMDTVNHLPNSTDNLENSTMISGNVDINVEMKKKNIFTPSDTMIEEEEMGISYRLIILGIIFSAITITLVSIRVKKEMDQVRSLWVIFIFIKNLSFVFTMLWLNINVFFFFL